MLQPKTPFGRNATAARDALHAATVLHRGTRAGTRPGRGAGGPGSPQPGMLELGGVPVRLMDFDDAVSGIIARAECSTGRPLGVCSANLDHILHFGAGGRWAGVLGQASSVEWLTLMDGAPLVSAARRMTSTSWPRLAGSDLIGPLLDEAGRRGLRVGFLGGSDEAQAMIKRKLAAERPDVAVAGWWAPSREVLGNREESRALAARIKETAPHILVVGLGKPRQELWIDEYGPQTGARVLLAFGAVVDFLAGRVRRAPAWISSHGLEWGWRLMLEPRRLARRYLVDGPEAYFRLQRTSGPWLPAAEPAPSRPTPVQAAGHTAGSFVPAEVAADVAVLAVTYNNADDVDALIAGLRQQTAAQSLKVVVADNSPTGETLQALARHPDVVAVATGGNLGYAGGINAAMRQAGEAGAYLVLNPDLRVEPGAVAAMRHRMEATGAGMVVPVLLDDDGSVYPSLRREPGVLRALGDAALGSRLPRRPGWLAEMDFEPESYRHAHRVDWATGAAMLIHADVARAVGWWDERFFLYSEETDYCRRVRAAGASIWFEPEARMWHERGGSGTSPQLTALMSVNRVRYAEKYFGPGRLAAFRVAAVLAEVLRSGKPGHREALEALLSSRRREALPGATLQHGSAAAPPSGTIVIPAHNEAAVIGRTLTALADVIGWGTVEVIVACNGCTDGTEEIASAFDGVRVLHVAEASKTAALNAADQVAKAWPRLYLDADIEVSAEAVGQVLRRLAEGTSLAARPAFVYDTQGASPLVRSYYRARMRIPSNSQALWGAGVFGLSRKGHARLGSFPAVTGDDYYVDRLFGQHEKAVLETEPVVVRTPRSASALLGILGRNYRGNAQQDTAGGTTARGTVRQLLSSVRGPLTAVDAAVYVAFAGAGRRRAVLSRRTASGWERDNSSR
ncbi:WecB/TagA/CpsF family glycosyltransferase [Paenarthrobacter sp. NCHU4564]|uniref:WecB/TagA/CpsF family glycosyltransferase n=1 Tax=Paenarthrobacter sp. NCHU4564 TaxID=3451353 RepID=UPI003F9DDF03